MSYYGNPYNHFLGGNASPHLPPQYSGLPQQSFNFYNAATGPSASEHPRHPPYFGHHFGGPSFSPRYAQPHQFPHGYPSRHHEPTDLDEEERATLAHLHSIQQRREAEQAAVRREAEIRARAEEERLASLRLIAERQARERAIQDAVQERQRQKAALQQAVIEHRERQQRAAAKARQAQIEAAIQAKRQDYIDAHRARQAAQQKRLEAAISQKAECAKRCAAKCAQRASRAAVDKAKVEYQNEFEALKGILGGLFGFNLVQDQEDQTEKAETKVVASKDIEKKPEDRVEEEQEDKHVKFATDAKVPDKQSASFPEDVNDLLTHFLGLRVEPTSADKPAAQSTNKVPEGLNEFLSRFGLVFEPLDLDKEVKDKDTKEVATESTSTSPASDSVTSSEKAVADPPVETLPPVAPSTPSPAASSSTTTKSNHVDDAPLTSFLNSFTDLPPFVRDILGNVEIAFKEELAKKEQAADKKEDEEVKGKGKGVAPGEKREVPIPTPAQPQPHPQAETKTSDEPEKDEPSASLSKLGSISEELDLVLESFTFPPTLAFGPSPQSVDTTTPALLFNKTNSPYHAQAHKLLQLLLAADGVSSGGNKDVRKKRKEVVAAVEKALAALESKRDEVWQEVKEKRENGEVEEVDHEGSASSSETSSVADAAEHHADEEVEHIEHVEEPAISENEQPIDKPTNEENVRPIESSELSSGDKPSDAVLDASATAVDHKQIAAADETVPAESTPSEADSTDVNKQDQSSKPKKGTEEEGYELL